MDVSIIIANFNTFELTSKCINSIFKWTHDIEFEVIVVDNNSNDKSKENFKNDKRIIFIENDMNYGFGIANNIGYSHATGKYIFLLNSDTLLLNNAVKLFYDYSENNDIQISGALLLDKNLDIIHSYGSFLSIKYEIRNLYNKLLNKERLSPNPNIQLPLSVDWITGADLFLKKTLIQEIGLFDPHFFMYGEDVDLQYRINKLNIPRYIIDGPRIIHYMGGSDLNKNRFNMRKKINFFYSVFLLKRKHYNYPHYLLYRIMIILYMSYNIVLSSFSKEEVKYIKFLFLSIRKHPNYILGEKISRILF